MKVCHFDEMFAIVGLQFCKILNTPSKDCQRVLKSFQSGAISPNLVTLLLSSMIGVVASPFLIVHWPIFVLRKWANPGLFLFFRPFLIEKVEKSINGVLVIQTQGRRMVGADDTMELWQPPHWPILRRHFVILIEMDLL